MWTISLICLVLLEIWVIRCNTEVTPCSLECPGVGFQWDNPSKSNPNLIDIFYDVKSWEDCAKLCKDDADCATWIYWWSSQSLWALQCRTWTHDDAEFVKIVEHKKNYTLMGKQECQAGEGAESWSYKDVAAWSHVSETCKKGKAQSPININRKDAKKSRLGNLVFKNFDKRPSTATLSNNGHTLEVDLSESTVAMTTSGGGLKDVYNLSQFHFHWGSVDTQGSEHSIDKKRYPLEMHMVHLNAKYAAAEALNYPDGALVVEVFFEVADSDNKNLQKILDQIPQPEEFEITLSAKDLFPISNLLPAARDFFRYQGSLTTPSCNEAVTWNLMKQTLPVSSAQLLQFRSLTGHHGDAIQDNFRPTQKLNGRKVLSSN